MVKGDFANGEYFIDCRGISQSALRAISGVWINICVATIAICARFIFRSQVKKCIASRQGGVNLWRVSPAVTPSEAFELRGILARALMKGDISFVFVSTFCIVAAVVSAASTVISNHVVVTNNVVRDAVVQGRLVTNSIRDVSGLAVAVSARVNALRSADAPLDELFDFVPEDDSQWTYIPSQWNNTWKGSCSFAKHEAVELIVHPTNQSDNSTYQDEVPLLGNYIPSWATVDKGKQGVAAAGLEMDLLGNGTGAWRDMLKIYIFGSAAGWADKFSVKSTNISIVNFLAHHVEAGLNSSFSETRFRSDVHTAECQFVNSKNHAIFDQASVARGSYSNAAQIFKEIYVRAVINSSIAERPVTQPTGQEMLLHWQAYMSVKDATLPHYVARILSVRRGVVQIRLSFLVVTIGAFLFANLAAAVIWTTNLGNRGRRIDIPSSQLGWMVQAAREHVRYHTGPKANTRRDGFKPTSFASRNEDLALIITPDLEPRIATADELSVPLLEYGSEELKWPLETSPSPPPLDSR